MSAAREAIMGRVRAALARLPQREALPEWEQKLVAARTQAVAVDLWEQLAESLKNVHGTPLGSVGELVTLLQKMGARRGYCDPALWPQVKTGFPASLPVETEFDRMRVDDYDFGITEASGAIAETGTVILTDGQTSRRLGALAPWTHVAVLRRDQIHADIPAALAAMPVDPNVIWVTGPSKTADVEGILIEGVHGPGVQAVLLIA